MIKTILKFAGAAILMTWVATSVQAQPALYVAGTHYEEIATPVRTNNPEKIEVLEVF
jgi:protein dithiol oxidoreductase (disulfide-forming)